MAEQKKPKIDLKARLGKKSVAAPTGKAIPPPVGIPKPPVMGAGMHAMDPGPKVDASDPYAAIEARHAPKPAEKAIKVEMSEEVVQAQKKGRARIIAMAAAAAVVGLGLGWAFGSGVERGKGADQALEGAQDLVKEVDAANVIAGQLLQVLEAAGDKLSKSEFPADEVTKLGAINVPFEGANLVGKGIGRFNAQTVTMLIDYAGSAQRANEQKERIQLVLTGARQAVEEVLTQQKNPKIRWSVILANGPHGPWANMQPVPAPFLVHKDAKSKDADGKEKSYDWPAEFKIKDEGKETTFKRYSSGDPLKGDPLVIPVVPQTENLVCPSTTLIRLRTELVEMQKILKGDPTPGVESTGLTQLGDQLIESLKKIGTPG